MTEIDADISIEVKTVVTTEWLRNVLITTLSELREDHVHIGLAVCGALKIRRLNREYREKDEITNVISFPIRDDKYDTDEELGDIVICYPQAISEMKAETGRAVLEKKHIMIKMAELVVHGTLHLCGIHHDTAAEEKEMYETMERCLTRMDGDLI